ncbi:Uncharacterised protein [Mycolicibacterium aurum]|uniref:Scaffolding protein n=1 Tax=Mycolicibacterium aurum TaxID=1791 RepID=A0A3S5EJY7_MYCAU|nr:hypothetical protein [Mycolicibacterium aurum]VEG58145.1 Uncharacterised protein [Mycolicibacterium aurum]
MTTIDTNATDTDETPEGDTSGTPDAENGSQADSQNAGLVEARDRYRTERDTAREELQAAQTRIDRMHRAEVERLASDGLSHPADLFSLSGNDVADYLGDDGMVDPDKVAADVVAILAERPGLKRNVPAFDQSQGRGGGKPKARPGWGSILNPET